MGIGFVVFPFSWRFGTWCRDKKDILALGPFRLVWHKQPGEWKK